MLRTVSVCFRSSRGRLFLCCVAAVLLLCWGCAATCHSTHVPPVRAACVLDVRMGSVLHRWQAHDFPVVNVFPLGGSVLTVAGDHTAQLWNPHAWQSTVIDRKLLCKSVATAPLEEGSDDVRDSASSSFIGAAGLPIATPPRPSRSIARPSREVDDSVSVSSSVTYRNALGAEGNDDVVVGASGIVIQKGRSGAASLRPPPKPPSRSAHKGDGNELHGIAMSGPGGSHGGDGGRMKPVGSVEGVLGGGSGVTIWRPQGCNGAVQLLSSEGSQVGVSVVKVCALNGAVPALVSGACSFVPAPALLCEHLHCD